MRNIVLIVLCFRLWQHIWKRNVKSKILVNRITRMFLNLVFQSESSSSSSTKSSFPKASVGEVFIEGSAGLNCSWMASSLWTFLGYPHSQILQEGNLQWHCDSHRLFYKWNSGSRSNSFYESIIYMCIDIIRSLTKAEMQRSYKNRLISPNICEFIHVFSKIAVRKLKKN